MEVTVREARLRAPWLSAAGAVTSRPVVELVLTGDDGVRGVGEAAPLQAYDGVSVEQVTAALEAWTPGQELPALPQAAAAIDLARWDLRGQREGAPVWRLLGGSEPPRVAVNATIGAEDPAAAAAQASKARAAGFPCVKVKVGSGDDISRVEAVRRAAPELAVRVDANGAWTVESAVAALRALDPFRLELCEEPVHGAGALARVAAGSPIPISADESAREVLDVRACRAVCLKISASGGITGLVRDAARARATGYEVYLASTLDGPVGIAAALHAAAAVRPDRACGLATLAWLEGEDPLPPVRGTMSAPSGPGLGLRQFL